MGSIHDDRWRDLDRAIEEQFHMENARRQYKEMCENGNNVEDRSVGLVYQTFEEWYEAGNYNRHDWGNQNEEPSKPTEQ